MPQLLEYLLAQLQELAWLCYWLSSTTCWLCRCRLGAVASAAFLATSSFRWGTEVSAQVPSFRSRSEVSAQVTKCPLRYQVSALVPKCPLRFSTRKICLELSSEFLPMKVEFLPTQEKFCSEFSWKFLSTFIDFTPDFAFCWLDWKLVVDIVSLDLISVFYKEKWVVKIWNLAGFGDMRFA